MILFTVLIIGLSGVVAQIVILRELLVNFYGNELTVGIILANWVLLEASGVFIAGRWIDRIKNKLNAFIALNVLFSLILPFAVYFSRIFKETAGIPFIEAVSLSTVFVSSFILMLPVAFLHGALFSCGCRVYSLDSANHVRALGKVYSWETIGSITGGLFLAYLLVPFLNSFQIALIVTFLNLSLCLLLMPIKKRKYLFFGILLILSAISFAPLSNFLQLTSIQKQFKDQEVLDYRNSNYANIAVIKKFEQKTFFYNGIPLITTPFPDRQFVEDFGNLPLLFHSSPNKVLIAAGGAGGIIEQALRHPVENVDYVEIDPLIIQMLKEYPSPLTAKELTDKRVSIKNTDPRIFLREKNYLYDVALIGLSNQADLSCNRFFTEEFFALVKSRLKDDGLLALWMNGSLAYLSQEEKDLNRSILNSLRGVYKYVRIIPGDYNIFIASNSGSIMSVDAVLLSKRLSERNIARDLLVPDYLKFRLSDKWLDWFNAQMNSATKEANRDLRPIAVYETLKLTNKKFSPGFSRVFAYLNFLDLKFIFFAIFLTTIAIFFISKRFSKPKIPVAYAIFTTGFFGMSANLLLIFAYQVFCGYLYQKISILTAAFMFGIAIGSFILIASLDKIKNNRLALIGFEALIALFSLALGVSVAALSVFSGWTAPIIYSLLFILGLFMGIEFPLAGKIYLEDKAGLGGVSGLLYASDLIGGWLAGILTGIAFLPLLGFFDTCLVIFMLKASSLIILRSTSS